MTDLNATLDALLETTRERWADEPDGDEHDDTPDPTHLQRRVSDQYALHLADTEPRRTARAPRKTDTTDRAFLGRFVAEPTRLLNAAGGLRAALELGDDDLARHGVTRREADTLRAALALGRRYMESALDRGQPLESPAATRLALTSRIRDREHEIFLCLFLDNRHRIIEYKEMFRGTVSGASVHPREIVKRALALNAAALIVGHNHPSGVAEPSRIDRAITHRIGDALALVDVRLLEHFVIGDGEVVSFAERGWL